jgi:hypothetical protein
MPGHWQGAGGSLGIAVASEHELPVFFVLVLVLVLLLLLLLLLLLHEMVLGLTKKPWDTGASSTRTSTTWLSTRDRSNDPQNHPKNLFRVDASRRVCSSFTRRGRLKWRVRSVWKGLHRA